MLNVRYGIVMLIFAASSCSPYYMSKPSAPGQSRVNDPHARIVLSRTEGFAGGLVYQVEIRGDGVVDYNGGIAWASDAPNTKPGHHQWKVDPRKVSALVDQFEESGFWGWPEDYPTCISEYPHAVLTLTVAGRSKRIDDPDPCFTQCANDTKPPALCPLESAVDIVAGLSNANEVE